MDFMPCSHVRSMMALNGDKSSITKNCMFRITGLAWTGSMISPRKVVKAPLNPDSIRPRFSRADGGNSICLNADICNRSIELLGSTKICLTSKLLIPNVRMRASWCGCNTRLRSTGGNVITPFIGCMPPSANPGWMELTCSGTEAAQSNFCLFRLALYLSSMGPSWI